MNRDDWRDNLVGPATDILTVMGALESRSSKIALVVDHDGHLLGTVTDGDIRRGLLRGVGVSEPVEKVMFGQPTTASVNAPEIELRTLMRARRLLHIPLLDQDGRVAGLRSMAELGPRLIDNWVVLMAGGLGSRLRPLTDTVPKPLLKVGDRPILETILCDFAEQGFRKFFISVNYKAEMLIAHFGDGARWGVEINYLHENERLGTAGPLSLLPGRPVCPLVVMNGDLLTKVNFRQMLDFHGAQQALATMCVREYDFQVPYGVIRLDGSRIVAIDEKPMHRFFINSGIYVLAPECLDLIPPRRFFDMPTLFERLIAEGRDTAAFPIHEYWLDIGRLEDFQRANAEYGERW
ncbi:nucleotidyltransferase family protein [Chitinimonas lacunae]|uniref:Nucleotidyltransferase family protein n=1 Tax=Chitinimonas lacunae TaxID=1963018 RepID=A0ABV8MW68_9NEIS